MPGSFAVSAEETASDTFYVDGSAAASGDGLTPETAVKTLSEGYALLDKAAGGKLVLSGPVEGGGFDAAGSAVTGPVTITGTETGSLTLTGNKATLTLSGTTVLENLSIKLDAGKDKNSVFLYSGADLTLGENLTVTGIGSLKVFCSDPSGIRDVRVRALSGTYHTFFMGGNSGSTTGNVDLTIGGTTEVTSNVTLGPNSTSKAASVSGNLHFTMEGGSIKVLYNTPNTSGHHRQRDRRPESGDHHRCGPAVRQDHHHGRHHREPLRRFFRPACDLRHLAQCHHRQAGPESHGPAGLPDRRRLRQF